MPLSRLSRSGLREKRNGSARKRQVNERALRARADVNSGGGGNVLSGEMAVGPFDRFKAGVDRICAY